MRSGSQPVPVGLSGEAVARQGRDHDIESVLGAASVRGRVRERIDDLKLLDDGSRPAVRDDDRERIRMTRADVNEVNVDAIDRRYELRKGIELGLGFTPVVVRSPIPHHFLEFCELHALRPVIDRLPIRPSRGNDAPAEIDELIVRNVDAERADCAVFGCGSRILGKQAQGSRSSNTDSSDFDKPAATMVDISRFHGNAPSIQRPDYLPPTAWILTDEVARGNESQIHVCVFHGAKFLCSAKRRCARNSLPINFLPPIELHPRHVRFGSLADISTRPNAARSKRTSVPGRVMTSVVSNADRERAGTTATHYMLS